MNSEALSLFYHYIEVKHTITHIFTYICDLSFSIFYSLIQVKRNKRTKKLEQAELFINYL